MWLMIGMAIGVLCLGMTWLGDDDLHTRFWSNFLHNSVFFTGIALMAGFFMCASITAWAGWYVAFKRIWESMSMYLIIGIPLMPKTTLKIGDTCKPEASRSQPRCVVYDRPDPDPPCDTVPVPMRFMRKGYGFSCRTVRSLLNFCDEARYITCDTGMMCGSLGVCVPAEDK